MNNYVYVKYLYSFYLLYIVMTFISFMYLLFKNLYLGTVFLLYFSSVLSVIVFILLHYKKELDKLSYNFKYHVKQIYKYIDVHFGVSGKHE